MSKNQDNNDLLIPIGNVINQPMDSEITQSYIDYAMSVIVSRALPDTRDGFKPVHRRILYAMSEMWLKNSSKYVKSARITWEVMGKYHPHGNSSIYEAMVRMAQDFSMRYPLVEWQWNFWSIDGDGAAAERYTEAKLSKVWEYMLLNIDEDTVDWRPTYDDSREEPVMLPTIFPQHLCNGNMGIAVGMATNMPPHNLTEVINASLLLIDSAKNFKINNDTVSDINETENNIENENSLTNIPEIILIDAVKTLISSDEDYNYDTWELNEELAEYLNTLPQKKIIVTNAPENKLWKLQELTANYGREIFDLYGEPAKSSTEYFKQLLESQWIPANKYIYIDHDQNNLLSAKDNGINGMKFVSNDDIIQKLNIYISETSKSENPSSIKINNEFDAVGIDDIMEIIQWPDFPTAGMIFDTQNIKQVYAKGKWSILMRGKTHIENVKWVDSIIITEIPYQVNKSTLVSKIWELVSDKRIEWISDIIDESSNNKIRVNIELRKWSNAQTILTQLYKYTDLQTTFGVNNITLVERWSQPRLLNIKDLLVEFVVFRREVVVRRSIFQLKKATDRLHILEGLKRAIDIIDEVIALIRASQTTEEARNSLMAKYDFTEPQAEYILKLTLGRLVWLELEKVIDEIWEKKALIEYLNEIINNPLRLDEVVSEELVDLRNRFGDERRTEVSDDIGDFAGNFKNLLKLQDLKKEDAICLIDNNHNIKILYQSRIQNVPEDIIHLVNTNNQDKLIIITDIWELVIQRLKDLWSWTIKQNPLDPVKNRWLKGKIVICETMENDYQSLCLLTNKNNIKKIDKELLLKFKKFPTVIMNLDDGENIKSIVPTSAGQNLWIISKLGNMVLFDEAQLRSMGKTSWWVRGIDLVNNGDEVAGMFVYTDEPFIMVYSDRAAKLVNVDDLKFHRRWHKWQCVAELKNKEYITWAYAIEEWNVRVKLSNDEIKTIHNDNMKLDDPETPLEAITNLAITMVYVPWEEKVASKKAKLAAIAEQFAIDNPISPEVGLFDQTEEKKE